FVSRDRLHIITERGVEGAPDLVIEILSRRTQSRDRGVKMKRYAAAGIPHYWIVVPRTQSIEAYRLAETGYELTGTYGPGSTFRPEIFPGLEISVDLLWE
ncbi:MAG: Uma2 family endonuclease, partial [Dehalococcoidia bacterium]